MLPHAGAPGARAAEGEGRRTQIRARTDRQTVRQTDRQQQQQQQQQQQLPACPPPPRGEGARRARPAAPPPPPSPPPSPPEHNRPESPSPASALSELERQRPAGVPPAGRWQGRPGPARGARRPAGGERERERSAPCEPSGAPPLARAARARLSRLTVEGPPPSERTLHHASIASRGHCISPRLPPSDAPPGVRVR